MVKMIANNIRVGNILEHNNRLWSVAKTSHTQPGKGGAFVQVEMKDIKSGTKLNERFRSTENVERAHMEQTEYQFLFMDGDMLTLMDLETYDQIAVHKDLVGDAFPFIQDSMIVTVESHDEEPIGLTLPEHVTLEIKETEGVVKGQTAASSYKPAILENSVRIMVPPFIEAGNKVIIRTSDQQYMSRAKA